MATRTLQKKASSTTSVRSQKTAVQIASVPDMKFYEEYIGRSFGKITDDEIFENAYTAGRNVLIEGPTGPGKTSAVLAYAAKHKYPFYSVPSSVGIEPSQLFGKFIPDDEGDGFVWQDGPVTQIVRNGGVLLLNEVNFIPERVATVIFGLLDKRREIVVLDHKGEVIRAHRGQGYCWCKEKNCDSKRVLIVADMNPDYEGTRPLNKAFRNRFAIQLHWDYDPTIELQLLYSPALVDMATKIRAGIQSNEFETPVSTNMLIEFEEMYFELGLDFAKMNFINHFPSDERGAIELIVQTFSANIAQELADVEEEEDIDDEEALNTLRKKLTGEDASGDKGSEDEWENSNRDWAFEQDKN